MDFRLWATFLVAQSLLSASVPVSAQSTYHFEYQNPMAESSRVTALDDGLFGDNVSYIDGTVTFRVTDISIKTNGQIPMSFARKMSPHASINWPRDLMGELWEPDLPVIRGTYLTADPLYTGGTPRCSAGNLVPSPIPQQQAPPILAYNFFFGVSANIPEAGEEELLPVRADSIVPSDGLAYKFLTRSGWRVSCLSALRNGAGEGYVIALPNGTKYYFDWISVRNEPSFNPPNEPPRSRATLTFHATKAVDRFGNTVDYEYNQQLPNRITKIISSDGAQINVTYSSSGRIETASTGTRQWTYAYALTGDPSSYFLSSVELPDQTSWAFQYQNKMFARRPAGNEFGGCNFNPGNMTSSALQPEGELGKLFVTHPSGAIGEFKFKMVALGYNNVPLGACNGAPNTPVSGRPKAYTHNTLIMKSVRGTGLSEVSWRLNYVPSWSWASECASGCPIFSTTTVTRNDGVVEKYTYGNDAQSNAGQLLSHSIGSATTDVKKTVNTYVPSASGQPFPDYYGGQTGENINASLSYPFFRMNRPLRSTEVIQNGVSFKTVVSAFDAHVRPVTVVRSSAPAP